MAGVAEKLGRLLRRAREAQGLSQSALAERAGLSENAIGAFERADRFPRAATLDLLVTALELDAEEMLVEALTVREPREPDPGVPDPGEAVRLELARVLAAHDVVVVELVLALARVIVASPLCQGRVQSPPRSER